MSRATAAPALAGSASGEVDKQVRAFRRSQGDALRVDGRLEEPAVRSDQRERLAREQPGVDRAHVRQRKRDLDDAIHQTKFNYGRYVSCAPELVVYYMS